MNTVIDKLFVTPTSWMLAVPIVLADRMLSTDVAELPDWDDTCTAGQRCRCDSAH